MAAHSRIPGRSKGQGSTAADFWEMGANTLEGFLFASWVVAEEGLKPYRSSWTTDF